MKDNSLKVGKYFKLILEAHDDLMTLVPTSKIYAIVAHENTSFPYIVYSRSSLTPTYSKDNMNGCGQENVVQITVDAYSDKYAQSLDVINEVRDAVENIGYRDDDINIDRFRLVSAYESWEDCFKQTLVFETRIS